MLSIKAMNGEGVGQYYLSLAREDYCFEGREPPREWIGKGSLSLALSGTVTREDLRATLLGFRGQDGEALTQNAGQSTRHSGWDLTFSAPKSVSVAWALGDDESRKLIENSHKKAVETVMSLLEEHGMMTRRGEGR